MNNAAFVILALVLGCLLIGFAIHALLTRIFGPNDPRDY